MASIKIIADDGHISGWFMSCTMTWLVMILLALAAVSNEVCERFIKFWPAVATIYGSQFTAWLAYRVLTPSYPTEEGK
jgi:hypothetical protein